MDWVNACTCSYNTLSLASHGLLSCFLFVSMYMDVIRDVPIAVTVTDTVTVTDSDRFTTLRKTNYYT